MRKLFEQTKFFHAQTLTELAVFGAIIIFIIGVIIRQSMGFSYSQNQNLKAMRMAMSQSFKYSQGLSGPDQRDGVASRNTASIMVIEDRLTADSAKYGGLDRAPQVAQGTATHSCNLFMPVEACEHYNMPVIDFYINGTYIALSTAKMGTIDLSGRTVYEKIPRHDHSSPAYDANDLMRFDLNHDGTPDVLDATTRQFFTWQWVVKPVNSLRQGDLVDLDGDPDEPVIGKRGDLKEEQIMRVLGNGNFIYRDDQDGDLDFTYDSSDAAAERPHSGLTNNTALYSFTETPADPQGTFLRIEEGRLIDKKNQVVRSVSRKDTIDLISRQIRLANDNHLFCDQNDVVINYLKPPKGFREQTGWFRGMTTNPVEACGKQGENQCLHEYWDRTCFQIEVEADGTLTPMLYVRSRIRDRRGHKWITNIMKDDYVDFKDAKE